MSVCAIRSCSDQSFVVKLWSAQTLIACSVHMFDRPARRSCASTLYFMGLSSWGGPYPSAGERYKKGYERTHKKRGGRKPGPYAAHENSNPYAAERARLSADIIFFQRLYLTARKLLIDIFMPTARKWFWPWKILYILASLCLVTEQPIHSRVMYWWGRRCSTWACGGVWPNFSRFRALIPMERYWYKQASQVKN